MAVKLAMNMEPLAIGAKIGAACGSALFASSGLDEGNISIVAAITCMVFVCGVVWWLAAKFQRLDDKLEYMHKRMEGLPCQECDWPNGRKHRKD